MTCRHGPGDRDCITQFPQYNYSPPSKEELLPSTPDKYKYNIIDAERVGFHLVLKVEYPNCKKCSYEGNKVMVFLNVSEKEVLKWREIDPHFRSEKSRPLTAAPSPACRFPASPEGWTDAITYAKSKMGSK